MQLKSDNNNREPPANHPAASASSNAPANPPPPPAKGQRPTYLPVPVNLPVACDYDSDESDGPILYRDDEDENMSEEGKRAVESGPELLSPLFRKMQPNWPPG